MSNNKALIQQLLEYLFEKEATEILFQEPAIAKLKGQEIYRCYGVKVENDQLYVFGTEHSWELVTENVANVSVVLEALKNRLHELP